jgi:hypothetical protein
MGYLTWPRRRILATCAVAVLAGLAGCGASPYGENTLFGGYRSERIDASHWLVQYDGNGYTPKEQVWAYWIYRCAEVTKQNGYAYFAMMPATWKPAAPAQAASTAHTAWQATPGMSTLARPAVWTPGGDARFVQTHSGGGHSYTYIYVPGAATNIRTWHTKGVVAMFNAPAEPDALLVMTAQTVLDDLGPYVHGQSPHPMDRELLTAHGLRWVSESGAVLPFMTPPPPPTAPAAAAAAPMHYTPRSEGAAGRQQGLAS